MPIATRLARNSCYINKKLCGYVIFILTFFGTIIYIQVGQSNLLPKPDLSQLTTGNSFRENQQKPQRHNQQQQQQQSQRDWHDYEAIARDALRPARLGEFGKPVNLSEVGYMRQDISKSLKIWGFNALLSEQISSERALSDVRHRNCQKRTYHNKLPKTSIIIVYFNERRSVLLRTLFSLVNRTPDELLEEIILVDDFSDIKILGNEFDLFIQTKFQGKIKIIHTQKRIGLIRARLLGARKAHGQVLVFLDAHIEATHNWLPPLLDPIREDSNTCTTPIIDTIHYENFAYIPATPSRGGFNWQFNYVQLPLLPTEQKRLPEPHDNPVMNGGLFAISKEFFWHLGGYDEGLEIWGAEQFELSFKIWMCGGRLLEVPCARLGHLFRSPDFRVRYTNRTDDFIARNYKRVAEVWMDSYKELLYEHVPKLNGILVGNLTECKALRRRLKCKSFKWFLETIAYDLMRTYPPIEPIDYARGALQSMETPELCLDALNQGPRQVVYALRGCSPDLRYPYASQRWQLSFRRDLRHSNGACVEVQSWERNAPIWLWPCHNQGGNQFWYYDQNSQLLVQGNSFNGMEGRCLEANAAERQVYVNNCDFVKPAMKWRFGYVNQTAMATFFQNLEWT